MRIGLIGAGIHGARYLAHLAAGEVAGARLGALCRADRARGAAQARALGVPFFGEIEALCAAPEVDAVAAAVPPALNARIVRAAAAARKPLMLEKPMARSVREGQEMLHAMAGLPLMVSHTLRFDAVCRALREH